MMRLNIEISAALSHWFEQASLDQEHHWSRVRKAVQYLPLETSSYVRDKSARLAAIGHCSSDAEIMNRVRTRTSAEAAERAATHPIRVVANHVALWAWRNGPVEEVHSGTRDCKLDLTERRLTTRETQAMLRQANARIGDALWAVDDVKRDDLAWADFALPFAEPEAWLSGGTYGAQGWSLTATSATILSVTSSPR